MSRRQSERARAKGAFKNMSQRDKMDVVLRTQGATAKTDAREKARFPEAVRAVAGKPGDFVRGRGQSVENKRKKKK